MGIAAQVGILHGDCSYSGDSPWGLQLQRDRIDLYKEPAYFVGLLVQSVAFGGHVPAQCRPCRFCRTLLSL